MIASSVKPQTAIGVVGWKTGCLLQCTDDLIQAARYDRLEYYLPGCTGHFDHRTPDNEDIAGLVEKKLSIIHNTSLTINDRNN
jgi:hypothetical protein